MKGIISYVLAAALACVGLASSFTNRYEAGILLGIAAVIALGAGLVQEISTDLLVLKDFAVAGLAVLLVLAFGATIVWILHLNILAKAFLAVFALFIAVWAAVEFKRWNLLTEETD